jgi:enoyl-CoA hydratase/carnithine racemase/sugar phosphate permease
VVAAAFVMMVASAGMISAFGVFVKPIGESSGWSRSQVAAAYAVNMLTFGAACFLFGLLADRSGPKRVAGLGGILYGAGLLLTGGATQLWHLYLSYGVLAALGTAALWAAFTPLMARWFVARKGLAVGLVFSGVGVGTLVMAPVARWLIAAFDWRTALWVFGGAAMLINGAAALFLKDRPEAAGQEPYGAGGKSPKTGAGAHSASRAGDWTSWAASRTRPFWGLVATFFWCCLCHAVLMVHVVAYATDQGMSPARAATLLGLTGAFTVIGRIGAGALADLMGGKGILLLALVAQTVMAPWLLLSRDSWMFLLFAVVFGLAYGGGFPVYAVLSREYFGVAPLGAVFGSQLMSSMAGMAMGGYLGGLLFDWTGAYTASFLVSLVAGVTSVLLASSLRPPHQIPQGALMGAAAGTGKEVSMTRSFIRRREGPVAVLTLARPPINALDHAALDDLAEAVRETEADKEIRALVITGGIDGIFCSGGDLRYWRQVCDGQEVSRAGREVFARIEQLPKPTIAAINGHVIGDGLALALACDLRIAAEAATFRLPELAYGFIPGWGLIHRLVALVGRGNGSELLLTGRPMEAARARAIGLVNEVVPADRLIDEALARATEMAAFSPSALRAARCALLGGDERVCFEAVWGGADWREGIDALLAKRAAAFGSDGKGGGCCDLAGRVQADRASDRRDRFG